MIKIKDRFKDLKEPNLPNSKEKAKAYGHDTLIKLFYNENKFGASPKIKEAIKIKSPNMYPEYMEPIMVNKLSEVFGLSPEHFYFSNGSDAILEGIPTLFASKTSGDNIVIPDLTFGRIETTASVNDIDVKKVKLVDGLIDLDKMLEAVDEKTAIVYIVNPNMPTGKVNSHEMIKDFMNKIRDDILVVIDEAYGEYAFGFEQGYRNNKELVEKYDNILITHTFSKMYGLASFRVGYMIAQPYIADLFRKAFQYLPVNKYSLQAAVAALSDREYYDEVLSKTNAEKEKYYKKLDQLNIKYYKSYGNFIYVFVSNNKEFEEHLMKKYGALIRSVRNEAIRITVGTEQENELVFKALEDMYA